MSTKKSVPRKKRSEAGAAGNEVANPELLRLYSEKAVDHMIRPRNMRRISHPSGYARVDTGHGECVEVFVELDGEDILDCSFQTSGCAATLACSSAATELVAGKKIGEALAGLTAEAILAAVGGLPEGNIHCASLAVESVRAALADALSNRDQPWKKLYRRL